MATIAALPSVSQACPPTARACRGCGQVKSIDDFHRSAHGLFGRKARCKACLCAERVERYNPVAARAYAEKYKATRSERVTFEARACSGCGATFHFYKSLDRCRPGQGKFCSSACLASAGRITYQCKRCGVAFSGWKSVPRKYCSLKCAGRVASSLRSTHSYASPTWRAIRAAIVERDGFACQRCGSESRLVVHHIEPWRFSRDNSESNLVTICRPCHATVHALAEREDFVPIGSAS